MTRRGIFRKASIYVDRRRVLQVSFCGYGAILIDSAQIRQGPDSYVTSWYKIVILVAELQILPCSERNCNFRSAGS
jgi:hypothetical protein